PRTGTITFLPQDMAQGNQCRSDVGVIRPQLPLSKRACGFQRASGPTEVTAIGLKRSQIVKTEGEIQGVFPRQTALDLQGAFAEGQCVATLNSAATPE